jgi:predicted ArsR family transcriptional regulator
MTPADGPTPPGPELPRRRELILTMLRSAAAPLSILTIADELGVHPNTARFHLEALTDAGRVERLLGEITGPGRPAIVYRARRTMDRNGPSNYRLLATMLTSHLASSTGDPVETATELGRRWGPSLVDAPSRRGTPTKAETLTRVIGVLADLGFEPEPHIGGHTTQIRLRHCPFLDLVDDHANVICSLHLGLMQGALTALNGPVTVDQLDAFVEPDLCVAHLASITASQS